MERVGLVGRRKAVRAAAPAAFLAAATIAVLLVRAALYGSGSEGSARTVPARAVPAAPHAAATASRRDRARAEQGRFYRIRSGDTLESVARRYRTTVDRLLALNPGVEPTGLRVGQRLRVG